MANETQKLILEVEAKIDTAIQKVRELSSAIDELNTKTGANTLTNIQTKIRQTGDAAKKAAVQTDEFRDKQEALARTNKAGAYTLLNFNRVVADSPFGILGVANNIDGLIQSFQNLQAQAREGGSVFGALKQALIGPAGIALAITAVTSSLIAFGPAIARALSGVTQLEQESNKASAAAAKISAETALRLQTFANTATNATLSVERQKDAFDKANEVAGRFGLKIKDINTYQKEFAKITPAITELVLLRAKADALATRSAENYAKAQERLADLAAGDLTEKTLFQVRTLFSFLMNAGKLTTSFGDKANKVADDALKPYLRLLGLSGDLGTASVELGKQIDALADKLRKGGLFTEDFGDEADDTKKSLEELREEANQKYAPDNTRLKEATFFPVSELSKQAQEWLKILEATNKRQEDEQKKARDVLVNQSFGTFEAPADLTKNIGIPSAIQDVLDSITIGALEGEEAWKKLNEQFDGASKFFSILNPAIEQAFNALANGEDATEAINQALKRLIVQLGVAAVKAAILAAIMAAITPGGAGAASAAGFGFSKLLGQFLGLTARASGGFVSAGQLTMVGEAGRELFVPQTSGNIVSNSSLNNGPIIPTLEFSYDRLRLAFNRANASAGRRF
jgi:hypothetical protein